jgi:hypothetical protein
LRLRPSKGPAGSASTATTRRRGSRAREPASRWPSPLPLPWAGRPAGRPAGEKETKPCRRRPPTAAPPATVAAPRRASGRAPRASWGTLGRAQSPDAARREPPTRQRELSQFNAREMLAACARARGGPARFLCEAAPLCPTAPPLKKSGAAAAAEAGAALPAPRWRPLSGRRGRPAGGFASSLDGARGRAAGRGSEQWTRQAWLAAVLVLSWPRWLTTGASGGRDLAEHDLLKRRALSPATRHSSGGASVCARPRQATHYKGALIRCAGLCSSGGSGGGGERSRGPCLA